MIHYKLYTQDLDKLKLASGFFAGWPSGPDETTHRKMMQQSYKSIIAIDENEIVGFVTIISDGVLSAYIPLLEVVKSHQGQGIGKALMERAFEETKHLYSVDLSCDSDKISFYKQFGMHLSHGMISRNYENQSGK